MRLKVFLFLVVIVALSAPLSYAQHRGRSFIREKIQEKGGCRNVVITKTNGDLMLNGRNYWAASGCPSGLTDALEELANRGEFIDDVQLTEDGRWLILYGDNGFVWNGIPYDLENQLREYNDNGEVITSVSFNDYGAWIVVTTKHVAASSSEITQWLSEGMNDYGVVWATCITDDAVVVVYERGYKFLGEIPSTLRDKLRSTSINVYRLKIAGESWFLSDGKSKYDYRM